VPYTSLRPVLKIIYSVEFISKTYRFKSMKVNKYFAVLLTVFTMACGSRQSAQAGDISLDAEESKFLLLINQYRVQNKLEPLTVVQTLTDDSTWHVDDMVQRNYFNHTDSLGRSAMERIRIFGYPANSYRGENIAAGSNNADATFLQWKNSPGHNTNMLNPKFKAVGIARSYGAQTTYHWYWNTTFGSVVN